MLLNRDRAYAVMDKYKLDGLIAAQRANIYYLCDFYAHTLEVERHFTMFAFLPRRGEAAMSIGLTEHGRLAEHGTWVPKVYVVTGRVSPTAANVGAKNLEADVTRDPAAKYMLRPNPVLTKHEQFWAEAVRKRKDTMVPTAAEALRRMVVDAGLGKGRLGADDPRVIDWLHAMGVDGVTGIDASNVFREIRMVKSPAEIELLRKSALFNEEAVEATIKTLHLGATQEELERIYKTELAKRDGHGIYILFSMISGLRSGKIVAGEPFMVDALGTYKAYHGDLGRTVVFGEPDAETRKRDRAMQKGWQAACEAMKPGAKGSDIVRTVMTVVQKEGFPTFNHSVAHTVGLEHTDHPIPIGPTGMGAVPDFTIEENMVLNFDMPYQEWGWGSMHIEDTLLVTKTGFEPLTSFKTQLQVL